MNFEILRAHVLTWASKHDLLMPHHSKTQMLKVVEEVGELASALLKNKTSETKDALGDVLVTLIILSEQLDSDLIDCLELAYNEVRLREGETVNGTFIKSSC